MPPITKHTILSKRPAVINLCDHLGNAAPARRKRY